METLLLLTYAALSITLFKVFKIPLNKWTVPTAVLGGIALVGSLVFLMNYNHPHSKSGILAFVTTPILPNVKGLVIEVTVKANTPVKKGDVLFKIDPTPFAGAVRQKKAVLAAAESEVKQLEMSVERQSAIVDQAKSEEERRLQAYKRFEESSKTGATSKLSLENHRQVYVQAQAASHEANAFLRQTQIDYESQKNDTVEQLQAELARAQFDLDSTIVKAPTDGYVTHIRLRPGMMAVSLPLRPVMVFVNKSELKLVANFRQNAMQRLKSGYHAEVLFPAIPGRVFQAEVVQVLPALAEGEVQANGAMLRAEDIGKRGLVPVVLKIKDEGIKDYILPDGSYAEVAVYSDKMHHVEIMRKILLRMKSWENYIYLDH
ncbi:MAG: HlyD family secretion protein [Verrucomicrobiales bacterium]|nr:HlyD family secretion protein [Verrucomicrobiales bacterium]